MKIKRYLLRIQQLDRLIRLRRTGTPAELSERMGLSESSLYCYLNYMRESGAPIMYSKKHKTYYYLYQVQFTYGFSVCEGNRAPSGSG